jgi:hypothetical protein
MSGILEVFYSKFLEPDIIGRSLSGPPLRVILYLYVLLSILTMWLFSCTSTRYYFTLS